MPTRKYSCIALLVGLIIVICFPDAGNANDGAASTAVGGLKLVREARVSMQKETLTISDKKVRVEYEFLNATNSDVTTEVAFPIPEYSFKFDDPGGDRSFDDFSLWVEGKPVSYQVEVKALCKAVDCTAQLKQEGVDIASFGHFDWGPMISRDFAKLAPDKQARLIKAGLIDSEYKSPQWSVQKTYYWSQTFPAGRVVHVAHEYKPVVGFRLADITELDPVLRARRVAEAVQARARDPKSPLGWYIEDAKDIEQICVDPALQKRIDSEAHVEKKTKEECGDCMEMVWVDYILTTANSWKTPIQDFELIVERPHDDPRHWFVSLCWDGPVQHPSPDRFVMDIKDFVPRRELRIGFLGL